MNLKGQFFANHSIHKALLFEKFLKAHSWLSYSLTVLKFLIVLLFHEVGT